ncbi:hypothetical protein RhiirA5_435893 [Rhizophagus irregularis]|uniref:Uncharacterized protein n=1 Tax=Rhizophagus irregularis TaxID=588596 RepID=A0A2I1FJI1_9GLOM|nr:hypothetical protein RhiirA5_435893 [Rhizophagus irregularis]PKY34536.1 hypothetical protein RhiirB3_454357 [Rhizophagus irregularis]
MIKTNYFGLNSVIVQALNNMQYRYSGEIPEMWYFHILIICKNTIKCANDHLKKCIAKTAKKHLTYSNPIQKNVKKRVSSELSDDEIDEIYSNIYFRYRKTSEFYCPCASKEVKKSVAYRLISSAKVIQWA